jgi:RNA polymerase sigma factor (sigma-70 family)
VDRSVDELRDEFYRLLDRGESAGLPLWHEVWLLFVRYPWYEAELHEAIKRLVWRGKAPADKAGDIEHDALLYFLKDLQNAPDLHVDRTLAEEQFSGLLARIIAHDCAKALRALRRRNLAALPLPRGQEAVDRRADLDARLDLSAAIKRLPRPERRVLGMYRRGWTVRQIAARLGVTYWKARRTLRKGLARLAKTLRFAQDDLRGGTSTVGRQNRAPLVGEATLPPATDRIESPQGS